MNTEYNIIQKPCPPLSVDCVLIINIPSHLLIYGFMVELNDSNILDRKNGHENTVIKFKIIQVFK